MKVNTVNVIEQTTDFSVFQLFAFQDNEEGNREAEERFRSLVTEHNNAVSWARLNEALEDGRYESGDYVVIICHSTN